MCNLIWNFGKISTLTFIDFIDPVLDDESPDESPDEPPDEPPDESPDEPLDERPDESPDEPFGEPLVELFGAVINFGDLHGVKISVNFI